MKYNASEITDIHPSFANMDCFALMIYKQRLLLYPEGQAINGLIWEMQQRDELRVNFASF